MSDDPVTLTRVLAAVERARPRLWALCYRLTGDRAAADDVSQEAIARAIERNAQLAGDDATGWLLRLTARLCIDHLRRCKRTLRVNELADPVLVDLAPQRSGELEDALILREDLRYAVVVALQRLSPRQRAALVLREVCDLGIADVADVLDTNPNAAKALLHRARVALAAARVAVDVDVPADPTVVERFARAIENGNLDALTELLAKDVWGLVDGGLSVQTATKPTFGADVVARQWANAKRRLAAEVTTQVLEINGEAAIVVRLAATDTAIAIVHLETRRHRVKALRVNRDPVRIRRLGPIPSVPIGVSGSSREG